jgi:hypothetical protein
MTVEVRTLSSLHSRHYAVNLSGSTEWVVIGLVDDHYELGVWPDILIGKEAGWKTVATIDE